MTKWTRYVGTLLLVVALGLGSARADEDEGTALETRLFEVGALTTGFTDYYPGTPAVVSPDMVSDEENPLFGAEGEEPIYAAGTREDLIDLLRAHVAPESWDSIPGALISPLGRSSLVVRSTPQVVRQVAGALAGLESSFLGSVTVELRAVRFADREVPAFPATDGTATIADDAVAELVGGPGAGPSLTLTAFAGQRAVAFAGEEVAYLQDLDVEVNQKSDALDPIVGVAQGGLSAAVRAQADDSIGRIRVSVRAWLAEPRGSRVGVADRGFELSLPSYDVTLLNTTALVPARRWVLLDGRTGSADAPGWHFLLRATARHPAAPTVVRGVRLPSTAPNKEEGAVPRLSMFRIGDLGAPTPHVIGTQPDVVPSNFTPPEPPELPDAAPALLADQLAGVLREFVAPASWDEDGCSLEVRGGSWMVVRNYPSVLGAVAEVLDALRQQLLFSVVTTARVVEVTDDVARRLVDAKTREGGTRVLGDREQQVLASAFESKDARLVDGARVTSHQGVRSTASSGHVISYLQDRDQRGDDPAESRRPDPVLGTGPRRATDPHGRREVRPPRRAFRSHGGRGSDGDPRDALRTAGPAPTRALPGPDRPPRSPGQGVDRRYPRCRRTTDAPPP